MTNKIKETKKKKDLDKFYTSPKIVDFVLNESFSILNKLGLIINDHDFLEPCAGSGAFIEGLKKLDISKIYAYDIYPESENVEKADFLKLLPPKHKKIITVGNPPFGYKGKLAVEFINKCNEWGDIIIFILPIQFRRYNIQKNISVSLKLIHSSENLPKNSFLFECKKYNVNSLFQIWVNRMNPLFLDSADQRLLKPLPNKHSDFTIFLHNNTKETLKYFNKSEYKWDFAVVRQGYYDYEEKIYDPTSLITNRQYVFIKLVNEISKKVFENIDFTKLSRTNTSVPGFSNTDLVKEYIFQKDKIGV